MSISTADKTLVHTSTDLTERLRIDTSLVTTEGEFDALERDWHELTRESKISIFQTFDWVRPWWTHFGKDHARTLYIIVFRAQGQIVGVAPLFQERKWGLVRLQFLGWEISDYHDLIIRNGYEDAVLRAFVDYLRLHSREWQLMDMNDVSEQSSIFAGLPGILSEQNFRFFKHTVNVCPQRALPDTWDEFFASLGSNGRYNYKRKNRNLHEQFKEVEIELFQNVDDDIASAVDSFAELHSKRWISLGYPSAFEEENHRAFHTAIAQRFAQQGWLRMWFLKVQHQRVAVMFNFMFQGRIYMYQSNAFGPNEIMRHSPGFLLHCHAIQKGIEEGMKVLDFLRGDESYKLEGMKSDIGQNWGIRVKSPSTQGWQLAWFLLRELNGKGRDRLRREWYGFRRFRLTKKHSTSEILRFIFDRLKEIVRVTTDSMLRNRFNRSQSK